MTSDKGDVIWDPFAGLCTSAYAAYEMDRINYSAEINPDVYEVANKRILELTKQDSQCIFQSRFVS